MSGLEPTNVMEKDCKVIVIGAGIGGLTSAALLAQAGLDVTVLEAHIYPGGCAGTFFHKKYLFDAGATLAGGFYPGGPMDIVAKQVGIEEWPIRHAEPAMTVHLPDGTPVTRWGDERRWAERHHAFGPQSEPFWRWQERTADALWDLALRMPPWPPQTMKETTQLVGNGLSWLNQDRMTRLHPSLMADFVRPVASHLKNISENQGASENLRLFVDAQLLIAAQTTSPYANALYGASALDLPRRGVVHLKGGIGGIAKTIAQAVKENGGQIHYRQEVKRIVVEQGKAVAVETKRGDSIPADLIIANLPPWDIAKLWDGDQPPRLQKLPPRPKDGWGAFMLYVGLDEAAIPKEFPLHHQLIFQEPMGEGNTLFLSLSSAWDASRGPDGRRALTISTHTALKPWWVLFEQNPEAYEQRKEQYSQRVLHMAERILPNLREAADLIKPGTPVTFQRFTRRAWGWVGGFPQTNLLRAWTPQLAPNLWMVGDSIFPGQSTAAVALGGIRVANSVLAQVG